MSLSDLVGRDRRQADRRQAAGHRADGGDAAGCEVEQVARDDHPDDRDEGAGDLLVDPAQAHDDRRGP